jgi:hypothetical protein
MYLDQQLRIFGYHRMFGLLIALSILISVFGLFMVESIHAQSAMVTIEGKDSYSKIHVCLEGSNYRVYVRSTGLPNPAFKWVLQPSNAFIGYLGEQLDVAAPFIDLYYQTEGIAVITVILYRDREALRNNEEPLTSDSVSVEIASCNCANSDAIIDSPKSGQQIGGSAVIIGRAQHTQIEFYKLDIIYEDQITDANTPRIDNFALIKESKTGDLATLDTTLYPDGNYRLRLTVVDIPRKSEHRCERPVIIANNIPIRVESRPTINISDANLRAGPGTDFPINHTGTLGQVVAVIGQVTRNAESWYQLSDGNWILSNLVDNAPADIPPAQNVPELPAPPSPTPAPPSPTPTSPQINAPDENPTQTPDRQYEQGARLIVFLYESTIHSFKRCVYDAASSATFGCGMAPEDAIAKIIQEVEQTNRLVDNTTPTDKFKTIQRNLSATSITFDTVAKFLAQYVKDPDQAWLERAAHQLEKVEEEINKVNKGLTAIGQ